MNHRFGIITLIGRAHSAEGAELALETVENEQRAVRNEELQERIHCILGSPPTQALFRLLYEMKTSQPNLSAITRPRQHRPRSTLARRHANIHETT